MRGVGYVGLCVDVGREGRSQGSTGRLACRRVALGSARAYEGKQALRACTCCAAAAQCHRMIRALTTGLEGRGGASD